MLLGIAIGIIIIIGIVFIAVSAAEFIQYKKFEQAKNQVEAFVNAVQASWKLIAETANNLTTLVERQQEELIELNKKYEILYTQVQILDSIVTAHGELLNLKALSSLISNSYVKGGSNWVAPQWTDTKNVEPIP